MINLVIIILNLKKCMYYCLIKSFNNVSHFITIHGGIIFYDISLHSLVLKYVFDSRVSNVFIDFLPLR